MGRYSAKLLFQFRIDAPSVGESRLCEERIVTYSAASADVAYRTANEKGEASVYDYKNDEAKTVYFEFVGVLDLLELGLECDPEAVWYDIVEHELPVKVPEKTELGAFRNETDTDDDRV